MNTRASCLAVGLAWFALSGARALAQLADSGQSPEAVSPVTAEALKDISFKPSGPAAVDFASPMTALIPEPLIFGKTAEPEKEKPTADADKSVGLSPFIVRELPHREMTEVTEAIDQQKRLRIRSIYKKDLTQKVRLDVLLPPEAGFNGTANLPLLRFTW